MKSLLLTYVLSPVTVTVFCREARGEVRGKGPGEE